MPDDDKKNARLIISQVILDMLRALKMTYPEPTDERREELLSIRERLVNRQTESGDAAHIRFGDRAIRRSLRLEVSLGWVVSKASRASFARPRRVS